MWWHLRTACASITSTINQHIIWLITLTRRKGIPKKEFRKSHKQPNYCVQRTSIVHVQGPANDVQVGTGCLHMRKKVQGDHPPGVLGLPGWADADWLFDLEVGFAILVVINGCKNNTAFKLHSHCVHAAFTPGQTCFNKQYLRTVMHHQFLGPHALQHVPGWWF